MRYLGVVICRTNMNQAKKIGNTNYPQQSVQPLEELDLHGKTREKAILSLTMFLSDCIRKYKTDKNEVWVRIVTGCGKHSRYGPVLRKAVQTTLSKREMTFVMDKWKGSFLVRADSGNPLTNSSTMMDSKLLIVQNLPEQRGGGPRSTFITSVDSAGPSQALSNDPLPSDVLNEDQSLQRAKDLSLQSLSKSSEKQNEKELRDIIKASKLTYRLENEILRQEEHFLEEVLKVSAEEEQSKEEEERMLLDKVISESLDEHRQWEEEESFLKEAIAASLLHGNSINYTDDDEVNISMMKCQISDFN